MNNRDYYTKYLDIDTKAIDIVNESENFLQPIYKRVDEISEYNQGKVLKAFTDNNLGQRHFMGTTGYGYGDDGRDNLDKIFSDVFECEDALVRPQWVSGTHVISDSLFALLRPGDTLLSITNKPYDTLNEVIGNVDDESSTISGSLKDWGINYKEISLIDNKNIDYEQIKKTLEDTSIKVVFIQRSKGYGWRKTLSIAEISDAISLVKNINPNILVLVDNCYGEFTERTEPSSVGADLTVGSLIKNPGGGLAPTGSYAVGTTKAIELLSQRLTSPGIGREVGSFPSGYRLFYQGLFMAPHTTAQAIKGAILISSVFEKLGYEVLPRWNDERSDIIQCIKFGDADKLISFCQSIQKASPVDSYAVPYPWDMPGYDNQVIMAAGTFVEGASIELSADAPIKEPYIAYLQGGLTYEHVKLATMKVLSDIEVK